MFVLKKTTIEKINEVTAAIMEKGTLIAPVKEEAGANFREIKDPQEIYLNYNNTILSPKNIFLPQMEDFVKYQLEKSSAEAKAVELNLMPAFLFGVRPCDVKSFEIMDTHFGAAGIIDPYWKKRRDNTTIIGYAFDLDSLVDTADFYNTLAIGAADPAGSDIFMVKKDKKLLLQGITKKGEKLLAELPSLVDGSKADEKYYKEYLEKGKEHKTRFMPLDQKKVAKKFEDIFENNDFWTKVSAACLSCGICTFVCPTCYCFDICDETLFRDGTRRRIWDACMFTDFTLEASGHNPRPKVSQRLRQKVCHKYSYSTRKYNVISCVGCGRCTRSCPVNIDIYSIVEGAIKI
jgi:sulfhydrogenase subunit beta (sulfur reductase)